MKLSRKELYDLVWSEPMIALAKRFGLSDNGLRKHCKSMNIPTPPVGYWSKLEHGKPVKKTPLSENYEGKKTNVNLKEVDQTQTPDEIVDLEPEINRQEQIEQEIKVGDLSIFVVPEVLYAKDPLIIDTKEKHREDMIPWSQRKSPYTSKIKESLNVYVGEKSIDRSLCIFSTIIKALRFRGHDLKIIKGNEYNSSTYAVVKEEKIQIEIKERKKQKVDSKSARDLEYCGELNFNIHYNWYRKFTYKDTAHTRLEDKIISIIAKLEVIAEEIKEERIAEEERKIRQAEEERIRKEREAKEREEREKFEAKRQAELKEFRMMLNMAERLRKANILRQYIADYEEYLSTSDAMDDEVEKKLEWARKKADWLDPFIDIEDEYLNEDDKDWEIELKKTESTTRSPSTSLEGNTSNFWTRPYRWFNKKR
ncbi:hypothetical protein [Dysgonomonas sp. Marseille-P4361]|uniref:hypothetical protein n=1 Tax=Dysgonomonas sp. Marseille-P4361 TaxID=2161820 RepID=UPI000D55A8DC|nr:hypothetical protein [Dysgonomonas sp. Marseille-P4361]